MKNYASNFSEHMFKLSIPLKWVYTPSSVQSQVIKNCDTQKSMVFYHLTLGPPPPQKKKEREILGNQSFSPTHALIRKDRFVQIVEGGGGIPVCKNHPPDFLFCFLTNFLIPNFNLSFLPVEIWTLFPEKLTPVNPNVGKL